MRTPAFAAALSIVVACAPAREAPSADAAPSEYLYLWAGPADSSGPDFLAVVDARPDSGSYGAIVATLPLAGGTAGPHHTEHELAADRQLFANGFDGGRSFVFDLTDPARPALRAEFGDRAGYSHPHSFVRLPNGNVLATFQMEHGPGGAGPGGLVELTPAGEVVRSASARGPGVPDGVRPYSAAVVPALDRIVTSTTDMHEGPDRGNLVQVWRLSDLALLHTFPLPGDPGGPADYTAEPRLLADGRTVLMTTFSCGLFLVENLAGDAPSARQVGTFPRKDGTYCAIPVVTGRHLLITVPAYPAVVSLDLSDPASPREVSRLALGPGDVPHWIALEPAGGRVVLTGYGDLTHRVLVARFDPATGALALDERFREPGAAGPGIRLSGRTWPHGGAGPAVPHGAVFSR
jgi:hypothetical protein